MDFSLWPAAGRNWQEVLEGAEYAERTGWHGVWIADHFMQNGDDLSVPVNECLALLAGIAARTDRVRVGSMVLGNTYRHPGELAKMAVTVDHISGGRIDRSILSPGVRGSGSHGMSTASLSASGCAGGLAIGHASHSSPMPSRSSSWSPPAMCSQKSFPFGMPSPSMSPFSSRHTGPAGSV